MKSRNEILVEIRESLGAGVITEDDIKSFITYQINPPQPVVTSIQKPEDKSDKLSVVDVIFYIAGLVLFFAILSFIVQSWNDGNAFIHILLSAGVGVGLWFVAYYLIKGQQQNDIRKGLINSLLLTGSLSIITGGYVITNELIGGFSEVNFIPGAIMLAILGIVHIGYDRLIKNNLILLLGMLMCVAFFPALLFGFLQDADVEGDIWSIILICSAGLLVYTTRVVAKIYSDRQKIHNSFDVLATFLALTSMYASSFGDYGIMWLGTLIAGVFIIFYLSIIAQSKHLLGSASFFLVLTVITISFRYFSGYGITACLILATIGLLATAAIASSINKKYFGQAA